MSALTKVLAYVRRLRRHGRPFATCPSIRLTSIPSRWPSANSKRFCARQPGEPFRVFGERFVPSCHASVLENVPITSVMRAMMRCDRETPLERVSSTSQHELRERTDREQLAQDRAAFETSMGEREVALAAREA